VWGKKVGKFLCAMHCNSSAKSDQTWDILEQT
jgi:hypothetical protein